MPETSTTSSLKILRPGLLSWQEAYKLQLELHAKRTKGEVPDTLVLLEHPHVFTLGKRGGQHDLVWPEELRRARGVDLVVTDRGGQATYHGPGQAVGYLILDLAHNARRMRQFIQNLEQRIAGYLLETFGLAASSDGPEPGIWIGKQKICAIGISVRGRVTMHGFALNVCPDLSYFSGIIPCGISDPAFGITSIFQMISPASASQAEAASHLAGGFAAAQGAKERELFDKVLDGIAAAFLREPLI